MNKYVKDFFLRGLMFGGFGPIVVAIVLFVVSFFDTGSLSASQLRVAVVSSYILAFVQAGATVFNQIEQWPILKSIGVHFLTLYITYSLCYMVNSWIPFEPKVLLIFTGIFIAVYAVVYITVYLIVRSTTKKLNKAL